MNQPHGTCQLRHEELLATSSAKQRLQTNTIQPETYTYDANRRSAPLEQDWVECADDIIMGDPDKLLNNLSTSEHRHIFSYTGSAATFGRGITFMDKFDMDPNAIARVEYSYYPFASRDEWEFA